ncbi:hypothetical protein Tco_0746526 [Tanacetum coccineum]
MNVEDIVEIVGIVVIVEIVEKIGFVMEFADDGVFGLDEEEELGPHMMLVSSMMAGLLRYSASSQETHQPLRKDHQIFTCLHETEAYSTPLLPLEILSDKPRESTLGLIPFDLLTDNVLLSSFA